MGTREKREVELPDEEQQDVGLEGAAEEDSGIIRHEKVEGGDEVSIGGSPPSGAGGTRNSPAPTREDAWPEE